MIIKLDDIDLILRWSANSPGGKPTAVRSVNRIGLDNQRKVLESDRVSNDGSSLINRKRRAIRILLEGSVYGNGFQDVIGQIRSKFKDGKAIPFSSDATLLSKIEKVVIEELSISMMSSLPHSCGYHLLLVEDTPPTASEAKPATPSSQAALAQAEIGSAINKTAEEVAKKSSEAKSAIEETANNMAQEVANKSSEAKSAIEEKANNMAQEVANKSSEAKSAIESEINSSKEKIESELGGLEEKIQKQSGQAKEQAEQKLNQAKEQAEQKLNQAKEQAEQKLSSVREKIKNESLSSAGQIQNQLSDINKKVQSQISENAEKFSSLADNMKSEGLSQINEASQEAVSKINDTQKGVQELAKKMPQSFPDSAAGLDDIF